MRLMNSLGAGLAMVLASASVAIAGGVGAAAAPADREQCVGQIDQSQLSPPSGYMQVIDATMKVTNDEDSGFIGYWALDNYEKHIQVWQDPTGTNFYVGVLYQGTWHTFAGALSPAVGASEPANGTGSIKGGYIATMTGSMLASPSQPTNGTIGSYDFGGTQSDLLLGSYGNHQAGATTLTNWQTFYFPQSTINSFNYANGGNAWGWRYAGNTTSGPWCNTGQLSPSSTGDIVTH